ncbi:MAG: ComEA family DNA-binding protein [Lachnospiraceae bacterium]|nr:ComEA family DNA-binding protein [Lachnospiraceae bacterium]
MNRIQSCMLFFAVLLLLAGCGEASYMQAASDRMSQEDAYARDGSKILTGDDGSEGPAGDDGSEDPAADGRTKDAPDVSGSDAVTGSTVYVQVAGAVKTPGVYELAQGSRIFEAIALAGGMEKDADDTDLNQAQPVSDGQKIYVRTRGEQEAVMAEDKGQGAGEASSAADDGKVNINTATEEQLATLPGIGQTKAAEIVKYREAHGGFSSIEDIMKVEGIKQGTYRKFCDNIKI